MLIAVIAAISIITNAGCNAADSGHTELAAPSPTSTAGKGMSSPTSVLYVAPFGLDRLQMNAGHEPTC